MADGFDIHISDEQANQLRTAALAKGLDPEQYARALLEDALERDNPGFIVRSRLERYDRTGEYVELEDALSAFNQVVVARVFHTLEHRGR